jgi:hypothetical protein
MTKHPAMKGRAGAPPSGSGLTVAPWLLAIAPGEHIFIRLGFVQAASA